MKSDQKTNGLNSNPTQINYVDEKEALRGKYSQTTTQTVEDILRQRFIEELRKNIHRNNNKNPIPPNFPR